MRTVGSVPTERTLFESYRMQNPKYERLFFYFFILKAKVNLKCPYF